MRLLFPQKWKDTIFSVVICNCFKSSLPFNFKKSNVNANTYFTWRASSFSSFSIQLKLAKPHRPHRGPHKLDLSAHKEPKYSLRSVLVISSAGHRKWTGSKVRYLRKFLIKSDCFSSKCLDSLLFWEMKCLTCITACLVSFVAVNLASEVHFKVNIISCCVLPLQNIQTFSYCKESSHCPSFDQSIDIQSATLLPFHNDLFDRRCLKVWRWFCLRVSQRS